MTHPSKRKGNDYEREIVSAAIAHGLEAKRAWGSNGEALGECKEVDLLVNGVRIQAKRRAKIAADLRPGKGFDAVAYREDRGESFVILRLEDFFNLLSD